MLIKKRANSNLMGYYIFIPDSSPENDIKYVIHVITCVDGS